MKSSRLIRESYLDANHEKPCHTGKERKSQKIAPQSHQQQPHTQAQPHTQVHTQTQSPTTAYQQPHQQSAQNYQSTSILKGFVLFSLALMISLTILYIVRHCIVDMVVRYGLTSKHEMLLYLLTLLILFGSFALYYTE